MKHERKYSIEEIDETLALKLKAKRRVSTYEEEEASLSITREEDISEGEEIEYVVRDGDTMFSICSYVAETDEAINLVEGERVYIIDHTNQDWWFVKKHLTEEKGWVPAQYLLNEVHYTHYLQRKLHEKLTNYLYLKNLVLERKHQHRDLSKNCSQFIHQMVTRFNLNVKWKVYQGLKSHGSDKLPSLNRPLTSKCTTMMIM